VVPVLRPVACCDAILPCHQSIIDNLDRDPVARRACRDAQCKPEYIGLQPWEISTSCSIRTKPAHTWRKGSCSLFAADTTVRLRRTIPQKPFFSVVSSHWASKTGCNHLTTSQDGVSRRTYARGLIGFGRSLKFVATQVSSTTVRSLERERGSNSLFDVVVLVHRLVLYTSTTSL